MVHRHSLYHSVYLYVHLGFSIIKSTQNKIKSKWIMGHSSAVHGNSFSSPFPIHGQFFNLCQHWPWPRGSLINRDIAHEPGLCGAGIWPAGWSRAHAQQSSSYSQRSARPATVVSWQREEDRKWVVVGGDRKVEMNKRKSARRQKKFKRACFANCYANKDEYLDKKNFS